MEIVVLLNWNNDKGGIRGDYMEIVDDKLCLDYYFY